ncbi:MAG TPA: SpvB/TcaC N-terminal domain-containing protein, partial [Bacteroidia bacterium]|nr:SpvB/TcaC N-terminal domain-containing protein [Bacteroidia bacterium]
GLHKIKFYKPRIEGLFARIERWTEKATGIIKWRVITRQNITTLFGWSSNSVIADPNDNKKIFEWLPEFIFDDKGNCSQYIYKKEDNKGFNLSLTHNNNRFIGGKITYANLYLERIVYGNKTPYKKFGNPFPSDTDYIFQTVFDYGEYDSNTPYSKINDWNFRADAFSNYKAGFEIRTTRLCKRILLFHHFNELPGGSALVRSLNFEYDTTSEKDFTFLKSVTSYGYIKQQNGTYTNKKLPSTEFEYQKHDWNKDVKTISSEDLVNAPSGLDEQAYQFTDLFNEGLSGILTEQANGWYYKHNLSNGKFEQAKLVTPKPSFVGLGSQLLLTDLDADGGKQLVSYGTMPKGYFELDDENEWKPFKNFENLPNIDFNDGNTRMLDLNGDGKSEVVVTEDNILTWYPSEGRNGYSQAQKTIKSFDEEVGPSVVFADSKQTIFLADMSGDGMTDIVRIRNGEICYWPNLGYGKFGGKVTMDNAPIFDHPDSFNPSFLKLADIDGSGTTDIIYLGKNKFSCWLNLNGNTFSTTPFEIDSFPEINNQAKITVTDLLGNGLSCIVWSSSLSKDSHAPLRYIDLMNSKKPHIMVFYKNNLGKEVSIEYTPSTKFYIEDKLAGKPWITKLQFPVHCISKTEIRDKISGSRFVSSYKYHHGYYDHPEREFRGFGMVEQTDSEHFENWAKGNASNIVEKELHQEPVISKSWFHTGAFLNKEKIITQFENDYWYEEINRQGFAVVNPEVALPDARIIPAPGIPNTIIDNMTAQEWREAFRACKSMILRSEIFAHDAPTIGATPAQIKKQLTPYSVATHNCIIELLQPKGKNKHAIFVVKESEAITYNYERDTEDPRISHNLNIKLDEYGNILESASVVYSRIATDASIPTETQQAQSKIAILYSENKFTNDVLTNDAYRLRLPSEVKNFELKGVAKTGSFYSVSDFTDILTDAKSSTAEYFELDKPLVVGKAQRRLIEHVRTNYYQNNLAAALPLHQLQSLAIPFESYQLAYTPTLISDIFGAKVNDTHLTEGKFTHSEGDSNWWIRSGTTQYITAAEIASDAQNRFYVPISYTDPFGAKTKVKYFSNYFLFIEETEDALGNKSKVDTFNFRTLAPQRLRDVNNNLSETISDELGFVKATAVMGKGNEADDLTGITEHTTVAEQNAINIYFAATLSTDLTNHAKNLLQHATTRFVYDFDVYQNTGKPAVAASIVREEHFQKNNNSPVQLSFEYSNGLGSVVMKKIQAEPGLAKKTVVNPDNTYTITSEDTAASNPKQLRWIGNGRTILNNKGNAVKQYEPYFSTTHKYEDLKELVETGVTSVMYYDPLNRLIKTEMPDATFSKVEFNSWKQKIYDANDTILDSSWYKNRTNRLIDSELIAAGKDPAREKIAADNAAKHANTPNILHLDTLGRPVLSIEHNKNISTNVDEFYRTKIKLDIEGNLRTVTDARELPENGNKGNEVVQYKYDMLGNTVYRKSMDAGQRWLLINILGNPLRTWDERNHEFQYFYDALHRPLSSKIINGDGAIPLNNIFDRVIYGEELLLPDRSNEATLQVINILGKPIKHFDTGGVVLTPEYNFKGQPKFRTRKLFKDYKSVANWTDPNLTSDLEADEFTFTDETDALGRIFKQTAADGSIITPTYNEAGLLNGGSVTHINPAITTSYIKDIDYNEKGQRNKIIYGNDVISKFDYDKETFRLKHVETKRQNNDPLQDWYYTFDPIGNITHIEDKNIPVVFFNNQKTTGLSEYTYDALYRLAEATGRENNAALTFNSKDNWDDASFIHQLNQGDPLSVRNYTQRYQYDEAGNIKRMEHVSAGNNWIRNYNYEKLNNRLKDTKIGTETYNYSYHPQHGFINVMPHLDDMGWNFKEELVKSIKQKVKPGNGTAETTYYQYDGEGQRIRKITENSAGTGITPTKKDERIYISGYETFRTYKANIINFERESLSLLDEGHRFVLVETVKQNTNPAPPAEEKAGARLVRYQLHNHLGSAALELDITAQVISYEEYHPFGTTAYQAKSATIKAAAKRYRFTGMERDEETGLEYHNARYYLPWLGRWMNTDPIGIKGGINLYRYCKNNPVIKLDKKGTDDEPYKTTTGPNGQPVYQSTGDQATKDLGTVGKALGGVFLETDDFKQLKKLTLDPRLAELKLSLGKDWENNKASLIVGGVVILVPTAALLTSLAVTNPKLDVPIVGEFYPRQGVFALASLGVGALTEHLTDDRLKIGFGYEKKDGIDLYSFEFTLKGPKQPEADKPKPSDDKKTPEKNDPNSTTSQQAQQKEEDKIRAEINAPSAIGVTGKVGSNQAEIGFKFEKPTEIGRFSLTPTLTVPPGGNTYFKTDLSVVSLVGGTRLQFGGSLFLNTPKPTGSPFDVKYDAGKNTATVTTAPPLYGSGFLLGVQGNF